MPAAYVTAATKKLSRQIVFHFSFSANLQFYKRLNSNAIQAKQKIIAGRATLQCHGRQLFAATL